MTTVLLTEHRACENCWTAVNDQGMSTSEEGPGARGWIHTLTGQYRCPPGTYRDDGEIAYALPAQGEEAIEARIEKACIETEEVTRSACENSMYDDKQLQDAKDKAYAKGRAKGRADYSTELNVAITEALHKFRTKFRLSAGALQLYDDMNEVLTEAWNSVLV
jgi:hypothetical protein